MGKDPEICENNHPKKQVIFMVLTHTGWTFVPTQLLQSVWEFSTLVLWWCMQ